MKRFVKGDLETIVEDDDSRIPAYLANGWKEAELKPKAKDAADAQTEKAFDDVAASEGRGKGKKAPSKKVNDAIKANGAASVEAEPVDDGLLKTDTAQKEEE